MITVLVGKRVDTPPLNKIMIIFIPKCHESAFSKLFTLLQARAFKNMPPINLLETLIDSFSFKRNYILACF